MKKEIFLCALMILVHLYSVAQFSFHVFPTILHGGVYDDTILNTSAILKKAGITQVNVYQTLPDLKETFASKTIQINKNGCIDKSIICFTLNKSANIILCVSDTITYDALGRIVNTKTTDNKGNKYPQRHREYAVENGENKSFIEQSFDDSLNVYYSYNSKGQLMNVRKVWKEKEIENTSFYYNPDGLLDSTNNVQLGTFIFRRKQKGSNKLIEMTNAIASYRWVYNFKGQCISSMFILKERTDLTRKPGYKGDLRTEVNYYYNPNGTLSKATTKSFDKPDFAIYYSYL